MLTELYVHIHFSKTKQFFLLDFSFNIAVGIHFIIVRLGTGTQIMEETKGKIGSSF